MTGPTDTPAPGIETVRLSIESAKAVAPPGPDSDQPATDWGLPAGCPVRPLGKIGGVCYYTDPLGQLRGLGPRDHSNAGITELFGAASERLYDYWPKHNKDGDVVGYSSPAAATALMAAAARRGIFSPDRERGAGAWCGEDGELILHLGDKLWRGPLPGAGGEGSWIAPGDIGRYIYSSAAARRRPLLDAYGASAIAGGDRGPAAGLLDVLSTWAWRRGRTDAHLVLGWIAAAMLGGALDWRPALWITGDRATGKSTLHTVLRDVLGDTLIAVSDATAAGIWQRLGHASEPVAIDELEAEADNRKTAAVINLARQASSGGVILRGGASHVGASFTARACFLFSSILIPPLTPQDRSRLAILDLDPLGAGARLKIDHAALRRAGSAILRRLMLGWDRIGETIEAYQAELEAAGLTKRGADQFGTLLGCADVALHDEPPSADELADWAGRVTAGAADEDDRSDHERCLHHLANSLLDVYRAGGKRTAADWLVDASGRGGGEPGGTMYDAQRALETYGLKYHARDGGAWLAVANDHRQLAELFAGSHWAGAAGASRPWVQALRRIEGWRPGNLRFAGRASRCTLIPLDTALGLIEDEGPASPPPADPPMEIDRAF